MSGYRYYSVNQLQVMLKILRLKEYGFSLDEIRHLIDASDERLQEVMQHKIMELEFNLRQETAKLERLKNDIMDLSRGEFMKQQLQTHPTKNM